MPENRDINETFGDMSGAQHSVFKRFRIGDRVSDPSGKVGTIILTSQFEGQYRCIIRADDGMEFVAFDHELITEKINKQPGTAVMGVLSIIVMIVAAFIAYTLFSS